VWWRLEYEVWDTKVETILLEIERNCEDWTPIEIMVEIGPLRRDFQNKHARTIAISRARHSTSAVYKLLATPLDNPHSSKFLKFWIPHYSLDIQKNPYLQNTKFSRPKPLLKLPITPITYSLREPSRTESVHSLHRIHSFANPIIKNSNIKHGLQFNRHGSIIFQSYASISRL
jgi:hypothetical protein